MADRAKIRSTGAQKITPFLWFDNQAEHAARFYVSVFKRSRILDVSRYEDTPAKAAGQKAGTAMTVTFRLEGQEFVALNGGPVFRFNPSVSFVVNCKDQREIDHFWNRLSKGGEPKAQQCGWLVDKYGLSWQVVPEDLPTLLSGTAGQSARVWTALLSMKKIEVAKLRRAKKSA
ncbi:MAG: VOC family protein [Methanobacteriota archaeon]